MYSVAQGLKKRPPNFELNASSGRKQRSCTTSETIQERKQKKTSEKSPRHLVWSQEAEDNIAQSQVLTVMDHVDEEMLRLKPGI